MHNIYCARKGILEMFVAILINILLNIFIYIILIYIIHSPILIHISDVFFILLIHNHHFEPLIK